MFDYTRLPYRRTSLVVAVHERVQQPIEQALGHAQPVEQQTAPIQETVLFSVEDMWGPGQLLGLIGPPGLGMTRVAVTQLAALAGPLAWVEHAGAKQASWFSPAIGWESGIEPDRLVVVRSGDIAGWAEATATLMDGMAAVCADVPARVPEAMLRRLAARARARRARLVLRSRDPLPTGIAHTVITGDAVEWVGAGQGRGRLLHRRLVATAHGKGVKGPALELGFEDDGTNFVCVVSGLGAAAPGRATG